MPFKVMGQAETIQEGEEITFQSKDKETITICSPLLAMYSMLVRVRLCSLIP